MSLEDVGEFDRSLAIVQAQYLSAVPLVRFDWQNILSSLPWNAQKRLLEQTICSELCAKYPMQTKYNLRFMRHIIDHLEATGQDVHDDLYGTYCEYQTIDSSNEKYSYRHFKMIEFDGKVISLRQANSNITDGTTGLSVWDAAMALAEWAAHHRQTFAACNVLELGSGTGLCGMILAKLCPLATITLSDGNAKVLECLRENVQNNFTESDHIKVSHLDWNEIAESDCSDDAIDFEPKPNLLIASDIVFDGADARPLCTTIHRLFDKCANQCTLLLANAVRNENTQDKFFNNLAEFNFEVVNLELSLPKHFYWTVNPDCPIKLYKIFRNQ